MLERLVIFMHCIVLGFIYIDFSFVKIWTIMVKRWGFYQVICLLLFIQNTYKRNWRKLLVAQNSHKLLLVDTILLSVTKSILNFQTFPREQPISTTSTRCKLQLFAILIKNLCSHSTWPCFKLFFENQSWVVIAAKKKKKSSRANSKKLQS